MSTPTILFLDTTAFDQNQYNFGSTEFEALLSAAKERRLTLLLPDPTERELNRHIEEKARAIEGPLNKARKEAPFVAKLRGWPDTAKMEEVVQSLIAQTKRELKDFLDQLAVERLDYQDISLNQIMSWYDKKSPPFSEKKPKEFPDAFAIASVFEYAEKTKKNVAVISADQDMAKACGHQIEVVHYPSITSYLDASLAAYATIENLKELAKREGIVGLKQKIQDEFRDLSFVHFEDDGAEIQDITVFEIRFDRYRIVNIGNKECLFVVDAKVEYSAFVSMDDPDSMVHDSSEGIHFALHHLSGNVNEASDIKVAVKCRLSADSSRVEEITGFKFIYDVIEVSGRPTEMDDGDDDEDY
jgi:hypothetical protein